MAIREILPPKVRAVLARGLDRLGPTIADRAVNLLIAAFVAAGVWFRAREYFFNLPAFWLDEAQWAMNLTERPFVQNLIRPPGFILISKILAVTLGPTERVLRALPWMAGILTTLFSPAIARRLFLSPTSRLFFVAALALNPCGIDFSNEFKPYALGLFLHLSLIGLALRYVATGHGRDLGLVLGAAIVGCLFAQDLLFAFPGIFLVVGWEAWKHRRAHLPAIVAAAAGLVVLLLGQYFLLWRHLPKDGTEYWGHKYNVFYTGKSAGSYIKWSLERYRDMTGFPGIRREFWGEGGITFEERQRLRNIDRIIWLAMHLMGVMVVIWRRRFREGALIVLPLLVLWVFNAVGLWPMGAFRTNIFTLAYSTSIAAMAFDVPDATSRRWFAPFPTLVVIVAPLVHFEQVWHTRKQAFTYDSKMPAIVQRMVQLRQPHGKAPLILDRRSCPPWVFYTRFHPVTSKAFGAMIDESYELTCLTDDSKLPETLVSSATPRQAAWTILHPGHGVDRMLRERRLPDLYRISRFDMGPHTIMSFRKRRPPDLLRPPTN